MDLNFCRHYTGDGTPPSNRYCRICPEIACGRLWRRVLSLAVSNGGKPSPLLETRAVLFPDPKNPGFVRLQVNCRWGLPKEDFLRNVATDHAGDGAAEVAERTPHIPELHPAGALDAGNRRTARGDGYT